LPKFLRHPLLLPFYAPSFILAFSQGMLVPILPLYAASFDISYGLIGLVLSAEAFGMLLADLPAGMLLRRLGERRAMLLGLLCISVTTAALFWTQSIPALIAYRLIAGFGTALYNVSRHTYLAERVSLAKRGRAIASFGGINRIGRFSGPAIGGFTAAAFSLRAPFLLFGGACIIGFLFVYLFLPAMETAVSHTTTLTFRAHLKQVGYTIKAHQRSLTAGGIGLILAQAIRAGRRAIVPLYAADVLGLDVEAIGIIESVSAAVDMSLFYPAGLVMDRFGRKFAIVPSFAIQGIGMLLIPLTGGFTALLLVTSLIGFGNGLGSGTMMTLGADLAPSHSRGEFLGVWRLIGDGGFTGGPLLVGYVADWVALPTAAVAMAATGFLAAVIFTLLVPETLRHPSPSLILPQRERKPDPPPFGRG
jgi:MFS family permease